MAAPAALDAVRLGRLAWLRRRYLRGAQRLIWIMMVVAMVNANVLEPFIVDHTQDPNERTDIFNYWVSFTRTFVSMFEITLTNWGPRAWRLMNHVDEMWGYFLIVWRCFCGFAVVQVFGSVHP